MCTHVYLCILMYTYVLRKLQYYGVHLYNQYGSVSDRHAITVYICIHVYTCVYMCIHVYTYVYICSTVYRTVAVVL